MPATECSAIRTLSVTRFFLPLLLGLLLSGCDALLFYPLKAHVYHPREHGLMVVDQSFNASDGTRLHGWFLPASTPQPRGSVLFLHGNAENISTHINAVSWLPAAGYHLFLFDYRGFGRSEGEAEMAGALLDAQAALEHLTGLPTSHDLPLVVFGQSIGAAIAAGALLEPPWLSQIDAIVLEGSFDSFRTLAREILASEPLTWPLQYPLSLLITDVPMPSQALAGAHPPLLIIHSRSDPIIPFAASRRLFEAASEPKWFWELNGVGHIAAMRYPEVRQQLLDWLEQRLAAGNAELHSVIKIK